MWWVFILLNVVGVLFLLAGIVTTCFVIAGDNLLPLMTVFYALAALLILGVAIADNTLTAQNRLRRQALRRIF